MRGSSLRSICHRSTIVRAERFYPLVNSSLPYTLTLTQPETGTPLAGVPKRQVNDERRPRPIGTRGAVGLDAGALCLSGAGRPRPGRLLLLGHPPVSRCLQDKHKAPSSTSASAPCPYRCGGVFFNHSQKSPVTRRPSLSLQVRGCLLQRSCHSITVFGC